MNKYLNHNKFLYKMNAKEERERLDRMISEGQDVALSGNVPTPGEIPELIQAPTFEIDYDLVQKNCDKRAKKLLKNATGLFIGDEMVKGNPYLRDKLKTDIDILGGMLYQMEVKKVMQRDLMEEVRHGNKAARMYEVFGSLGKVISEDNKQVLQTVEAIKETYISLKMNIEDRNDEMKQLAGGDKEDDKLLSMGSRGMINSAKKEKLRLMEKNLKKMDIKDVEAE